MGIVGGESGRQKRDFVLSGGCMLYIVVITPVGVLLLVYKRPLPEGKTL